MRSSPSQQPAAFHQGQNHPLAPSPTHSRRAKGADPVESPAHAAPLSPDIRNHALQRNHGIATDTYRSYASDDPMFPHRMHPTDCRTASHCHRRLVTPLAPSPHHVGRHTSAYLPRHWGQITIVGVRSSSSSQPSDSASGSPDPRETRRHSILSGSGTSPRLSGSQGSPALQARSLVRQYFASLRLPALGFEFGRFRFAYAGRWRSGDRG